MMSCTSQEIYKDSLITVRTSGTPNGGTRNIALYPQLVQYGQCAQAGSSNSKDGVVSAVVEGLS